MDWHRLSKLFVIFLRCCITGTFSAKVLVWHQQEHL